MQFKINKTFYKNKLMIKKLIINDENTVTIFMIVNRQAAIIIFVSLKRQVGTYYLRMFLLVLRYLKYISQGSIQFKL